jgi:hypothetical protein
MGESRLTGPVPAGWLLPYFREVTTALGGKLVVPVMIRFGTVFPVTMFPVNVSSESMRTTPLPLSSIVFRANVSFESMVKIPSPLSVAAFPARVLLDEWRKENPIVLLYAVFPAKVFLLIMR